MNEMLKTAPEKARRFKEQPSLTVRDRMLSDLNRRIEDDIFKSLQPEFDKLAKLYE